MPNFTIVGRLLIPEDEYLSLEGWIVQARLTGEDTTLATSEIEDGHFNLQFTYDSDQPDIILRVLDEVGERYHTTRVRGGWNPDDDIYILNMDIDIPSSRRNNGNSGTLEEAASLIQALKDLAATSPTAHDIQGPGGGGRRSNGGSANEWQDRLNATSMNLLGRRLKANDSKALIASLNQAVKIERVNGQKTVTLTPHTYAVQTELGAELTGAQASLYHYYKSIVTELLQKIGSLDTLNVDTDTEIALAERSILRTEILSLGDEFGREGGPRVRRVDQTFNTLFGQLSTIQEVYGYGEDTEAENVNTTHEERELTDFLIVRHYISGLYGVWYEFRQRYVSVGTPRYLGTQLILLARDLSVVAEAVDEAANVMDSVLLGSAERQTIFFTVPARMFDHLPAFANGNNGAQREEISLEDLLNWITTFATEEGPELVQHAGRRGVYTLVEIATELQSLVTRVSRLANRPAHQRNLPEGLYRERVKAALRELIRYLGQVVTDARAVIPDRFGDE